MAREYPSETSLNYLGKWISSYLYQRTFQVRVDQSKSTTRRIERGVPQGSVLGPVLFILYFNDIDSPNFTVVSLTRSLFADVLASWYPSRSLKMIQIWLQTMLDHIGQWMSKWRIKLSVQKTVFCIFNIGGKFNHLTGKINLNFEFLGVSLDPRLNLHEHAKTVRARSMKRLNMLKSTYWPPGVCTSEMYNQLNLEPLKDRAFNLTGRYLCKGYNFIPLVTNLINDYIVAEEIIEGLFRHPKNKLI
jgi:hypothetical protein